MSESYFWYTKDTYTVVQNGGETAIIITTLDPNGVSVAKQKKLTLKYPFTGAVKIDSEPNSERDFFIIADDLNYYQVPANSFMLEETGVIRLGRKNDIKKITAGIFVYAAGAVKKLENPYKKTPQFRTLKKLPADFEIMASNERAGRYLIKTMCAVFLYDEKTDTADYLELDAEAAVFAENSDKFEADFLYDNDNFYLIEDGLQIACNIGDSLALFNKKNGFLAWVYRPDGEFGQAIFEEKENQALWGYIKNGVAISDNEIRLFAFNAVYVSKDNTVIKNLKDGAFYRSCSDILDNMRGFTANTFDVSAVKNMGELSAFYSGLFADGGNVYQLQYNSRTQSSKFVPVKNLSPAAAYYEGIESFQYQTSPFFDDGGMLKFISDRNAEIGINAIPHKSALKFLEVAYLFDDKILIENRILESPLDYESAEFYESFADVTNAFSDEGFAPIEVSYRHYFRDKNGLYLYTTGSQKLEKLP